MKSACERVECPIVKIVSPIQSMPSDCAEFTPVERSLAFEMLITEITPVLDDDIASISHI